MKSEYSYTLILAMVALTVGFVFAPDRELQIGDMLTLAAMRLSLFFLVTMGFLSALRGWKQNIITEIFEQSNIAAAIFTGMVILGIAMIVIK